MKATEKHSKGARVYAETGSKSAAMRAMDRDPRNATRDFNTAAMRKAQSAVMDKVAAAVRVSVARLGKKLDRLLDATKTTRHGTVPDNRTQLRTLELVMKAMGWLEPDDRFEQGGMAMVKLLLPVIARYVRPEDKPAFDDDVARVLQSNG